MSAKSLRNAKRHIATKPAPSPDASRIATKPAPTPDASRVATKPAPSPDASRIATKPAPTPDASRINSETPANNAGTQDNLLADFLALGQQNLMRSESPSTPLAAPEAALEATAASHVEVSSPTNDEVSSTTSDDLSPATDDSFGLDATSPAHAAAREEAHLLAAKTMRCLRQHMDRLSQQMADDPNYELNNFDQWALMESSRLLAKHDAAEKRDLAALERNRAHERKLELQRGRLEAQRLRHHFAAERHEQRCQLLELKRYADLKRVEALEQTVELRAAERMDKEKHRREMLALRSPSRKASKTTASKPDAPDHEPAEVNLASEQAGLQRGAA